MLFLEWEFGNRDFGPIAARVKDAKPDFVWVGAIGLEGNQLLDAMKKIDYAPPLALLHVPGAGSDGRRRPRRRTRWRRRSSRSIRRSLNNPGAAEFVQAVPRARGQGRPRRTPASRRRRPRRIPRGRSLEAAVNGDQEPRRQGARRTGCARTSVDTIQGKLRFDGPSNYGDDLMRVKQVQNGRWVVVWPKESQRRVPRGAKLLAPEPAADVGVPMQFPSATLLAQSVLSGVFVGALYGLARPRPQPDRGGCLRQINLAHFALAFLAAYLCYQLSTVGGIDPLAHARADRAALFCRDRRRDCNGLFARFSVSPFNSLLVTFGLTVIVESVIQCDLDRRFPPARIGVRRREVQGRHRSTSRRPSCSRWCSRWRCRSRVWAALRYTDLGRALRAAAEDAPIAAAFGVNQRAHRAAAVRRLRSVGGVAGVCLALELHARAGADLCVDRRRVRGGDAGRRSGARSARSSPAS